MFRLKIASLFFVFALHLAHSQDLYRYKVDLVNVENDKVKITLFPPQVKETEVRFCFPAMVPGTYEVYNFGRFVSNVKAVGKNGAKIELRAMGPNCYILKPASEIDYITYEVEDTWDTAIRDKVVFEPAGSNIEAGNVFCINNHVFFGFYDGMPNKQFEIEFNKPKDFYPSTGLTEIITGIEKDIVKAPNYHELVDSPILYMIPDTVSVMVANTKVMVSTYSPNKKINSRFIAQTLEELLFAQRDYLGGQLLVDKYAFLLYFTDKPTLSGSHGALEHSYSSFYVLPEADSTYMVQQIRDIAAHEFFHIVTPLNIHSHEIGNFDYLNPKMSEHLWLYEGMTEYAAHHAQVKAGLTDIDAFLKVMMGKYETSLNFFDDKMSFTWMSKNVLDEKIHKQYNNVYEKGALIGMCLDIYLRHYSKGAYGTQNLMSDLSKKYGKHQSFNDEDLFREIEALTYPEIGTFLRKHVAGKEPLPMADVFDKVGLLYEKEKTYRNFTLGGFDVTFNEATMRLVVADVSGMDAFGKAMKYKEGDELYSLNGQPITIETIKRVFGDYFNSVKEGDLVTVEVMRPRGKKGKYKRVALKAKAKQVDIKEYNNITVKPEVSELEKLVFKGWLNYNLK